MQFEPISVTSRQNPMIQRAARLDMKKYRDAEGAFLIHGIKLTREAILHGAGVELIFVCESAAARVEEALGDLKLSPDCRVFAVGESAFAKISPEKSPDGVICIAKTLDKFHKKITIEKRESDPIGQTEGRLLLLERIRPEGTEKLSGILPANSSCRR